MEERKAKEVWSEWQETQEERSSKTARVRKEGGGDVGLTSPWIIVRAIVAEEPGGNLWGRGHKGEGKKSQYPYHRELWVEERPVLSFTHREAEGTRDNQTLMEYKITLLTQYLIWVCLPSEFSLTTYPLLPDTLCNQFMTLLLIRLIRVSQWPPERIYSDL